MILPGAEERVAARFSALRCKRVTVSCHHGKVPDELATHLAIRLRPLGAGPEVNEAL